MSFNSVQFCSNLSSASAGSRLAFLWTNQFTDLFDDELHLLRKFEKTEQVV